MDNFKAKTSQISRVKARTQGLPLYFPGSRCVNGHVAQRRTCNGACLECERAPEQRAKKVVNVRRWREEYRAIDPKGYNAERADQARDWRTRNPEKAKATDQRYRAKRQAYYQAYMKRWRVENASHVTAYDNAYKAEWREANPEAARLKSRLARQRRRAAEMQAEGTFTFEDIERLLHQQSGRCVGCGVNIRDSYEIDHVTSLFRGGTHWPSNLQLLCRNCNAQKHTRTMEEWLRCP